MYLFVSSKPLTMTTTITTLHTTTAPPTIPSAPITFSHDSDPFDPKSSSFTSKLNPNTTAPVFDAKKRFNGIPIAKYASVVPLARALKPQNQRQDRLLPFRPLFVYRQQQVKKQQMQMHMRPPAPYSYSPYASYAPYAPFNYPPGHFDLYDASPIHDIGQNELPQDPEYDWYRLPQSHFWEKKK